MDVTADSSVVPSLYKFNPSSFEYIIRNEKEIRENKTHFSFLIIFL